MLQFAQDQSLCQLENHKQLQHQLICTANQSEKRLLCSFCALKHNREHNQDDLFIGQFVEIFNKNYQIEEQQKNQNQNLINEQQHAIDKIFKVYIEQITAQVETIKDKLKSDIQNRLNQNYNFIQEKLQQLRTREIHNMENKELDILVQIFRNSINQNNNNLDLKQIRDSLEIKLHTWQKNISNITAQQLTFDINILSRKLISISNEPQSQGKSGSWDKITMDNFDFSNKKVYRVLYSSKNKIYIYENLESLVTNIDNKIEQTLSQNICGTYSVVYNNMFYSQIININSQTIGKFSITDFQLRKEKKISDSSTTQNSLTNWGGCQNFIFFSQPSGLYASYLRNEDKKLKIIQIDPESLDVIKEWITDSPPDKKYGSLFMIDNIIYGTENYSQSPTKITFSFDISNGQNNTHQIEQFLNKGGYDVSLHFNYQQSKLWTANNTEFYTYDVELK